MGIESNDQRVGQFWEKFLGEVGGGPSQDTRRLARGAGCAISVPAAGSVSRCNRGARVLDIGLLQPVWKHPLAFVGRHPLVMWERSCFSDLALVFIKFNFTEAPVHYDHTMLRLPCAPSHNGAHHPRVAAVRRPLTAALAVLVLGALGSVGGAHSASAATVSCDTPSLISAITTANGTPGGSTLVLTTGCVYTLASANNTTDGGTGLPVITGNVTIQGAGATITRSSATGVTGLPHLRRGQRRQPDLELADAQQRPGQQRPTRWWRHLQPRHLGRDRRAPSPTTRHPPPPAPRVGPSTAAGR